MATPQATPQRWAARLQRAEEGASRCAESLRASPLVAASARGFARLDAASEEPIVLTFLNRVPRRWLLGRSALKRRRGLTVLLLPLAAYICDCRGLPLENEVGIFLKRLKCW